MFNGYKIAVNTAAGRRRYMQYLVPQVVASDIVDRYDIWVNTTDKQDIAFFRQCAEAFPKINLVYQPDGIVDGVKTINAFYPACTEPDTIYIKLDDDILWLEPDFFEKMVRFRLDHPEYFVVSPLVINNMLCTYLLQAEGRLKLMRGEYFRAVCNYRIDSGELAAELHEWFMPQIENGTYRHLYCGTKPQALGRFSINSICWFGSEFKKWGGIVPGDDEEFLSCIKPTQLGQANGINGDCIIAHFAFFTQREMLDKQNILQRYGEMLRRLWKTDPKLGPIDSRIIEIMQWTEKNKSAILQEPAIYKTVPVSRRQRWKKRFAKYRIPVIKIMTLSAFAADRRYSRRYTKYLE